MSDSTSIFDFLTQERPEGVVGWISIGSGVAAYLAHHRPLAGMILVIPFYSLKALAGEHFRWAPVGLLLRDHMPTIDLVRGRTRRPRCSQPAETRSCRHGGASRYAALSRTWCWTARLPRLGTMTSIIIQHSSRRCMRRWPRSKGPGQRRHPKTTIVNHRQFFCTE